MSRKKTRPEKPAAKTKKNVDKKPRKFLFMAVGLLAISIGGGWVFADWYRCIPTDAVAQYVGRDSCVSCHQPQHDLFVGSHHDLAMDLATEETVRADFADQTLEHFGITTKFFRDGQKFMVNTEGPDGKMADFEIKYVFGYEPLQQYMVELKPAVKEGAIGQVQVLRVAWDTEKKKWFYFSPPDVSEKLEPGDPLHWTGITQNWNSSCAACHSTDLQKNYDLANRTYNTTFAEIDVSCESCHGPGSLHVDLAKNKTFFWDRKRGLALNKLKTETNVAQVETCAPCHSRRREIAGGFYAGCNFQEYFDVSLVNRQLYHCDGQIRDEVYVYGSFVQSKMYHNNIRCTDCHDPHSVKVKFDNNQLCTSCHQHPAAKYDDPSHHHHKTGSPGALCVECHMPETTYMDVDPRRDHSLRVPRPDLSLSTRAPNACTGCHLDEQKLSPQNQAKVSQYLDWMIEAEKGNQEIADELARVNRAMAAAADKWYVGKKRPEHYANAFDAAWKDPSQTAELMRPLINRRSTPALIRASATSQLATVLDEESLDAAMKAIGDEDPSVVAAALPRLEREISRRIGDVADWSNPSADIDRVKEIFLQIDPLTSYPARKVRIEAARVLIMIPLQIRIRWATRESKRAFIAAFDELIDSVKMFNERGAAHRTLGSIYETVGDNRLAAEHYQLAIELEPNLSGPRLNLSVLLNDQAEELMRSAQQLIQQGAREMAVTKRNRAMELAAQAEKLRDQEHKILLTDLRRLEGLAPTHGIHYQVGLSFYRKRDLGKTEYHLLEAYKQRPQNEQYVLALTTFYHGGGQRAMAIKYVDELMKINSQNPGYRQLRDEIYQKPK